MRQVPLGLVARFLVLEGLPMTWHDNGFKSVLTWLSQHLLDISEGRRL